MEWLSNIHPILGGLLFVMFAFQGITGTGSIDAIEEQRQDKGQARWHRRNGRALVALLPAVYVAGLLTVLYNHDMDAFAHPPHLITGSLLLVAATAAFFLARRSRRTGSKGARNVHITLGAFTIALYVVQAAIGLGMLLGIRLT